MNELDDCRGVLRREGVFLIFIIKQDYMDTFAYMLNNGLCYQYIPDHPEGRNLEVPEEEKFVIPRAREYLEDEGVCVVCVEKGEKYCDRCVGKYCRSCVEKMKGVCPMCSSKIK